MLSHPVGPRMWFCPPDPWQSSAASVGINWLNLRGFYLVMLFGDPAMATGCHNVTPDNRGYLMNSLLKKCSLIDWSIDSFFFLIFLSNWAIVDLQCCVSGVQQSDSVIHISILFQILFPFGLLQNTEQSSLCYTVGPCWLSILNIVVCIWQSQTPSLSLPSHLSPSVTISLFSKSVSLFLFCVRIQSLNVQSTWLCNWK